MKRPKKRYTVYSENQCTKSGFLEYFSTDSRAMAASIVASLQRIAHKARIVDNRTEVIVYEG